MARRKRTTHASDRIAKAVDKTGDRIVPDDDKVVGPSPNPATNLLIHDILLRGGGRLMRLGLEKGLLRNRYGGSTAKDIVENRTLLQTLGSVVVARVATRSIPGAVVVGGGLLARALLDRRKSRLSAQRKGDKALRKQAKRKK
ncbi:hypothetical protein [Pelagerythrobacter sp.]|uniref:hypothetical protein n=1 Tax=Pelagerythrobacter sp. TaxID=2800702 RepID=UPI0035AFE186